MRRAILFSYVLFIIPSLAFSWGGVGHKIISRNAVKHLPSAMQKFIDQQSYFEAHASDADSRIYQVTPRDTAMFAEQYRHYLDVDDYPNFKRLTRSFDTLVTTYGWVRVKENGTNPWTVVWVMDSLTAQLKRGDWNTAYQTAADLGHYVADPHQPLHAVRNYDGKETGNNGIHSRYESRMVEQYQEQISVTKDSVKYISDVYGFVFAYILKANSLADSILHADNFGKAQSGWNGSGTPPSAYYNALWQQLGEMTKAQIQSATIDLASLWYTAWVNAGLISSRPTDVKKEKTQKPKSFNLQQNYPNPFNPKTKIEFDIAETVKTKLEIYSVGGKLICELVNGTLDAGSYSAEWDAQNVSSGLYFYRLDAGQYSETKKLVIVK